MADWNPAQYERFKDERSRPFFDLLALVEPRALMHCVDLGCGTGELTRHMHAQLSARATVGVDSSTAMLGKAAAQAGDGLTFVQADIASWSPEEPLDLVFSNAALHWLNDHEALLARLAGWLSPTGQLAVQVPSNNDHPAHQLAHELAGREPYRTALGGYVRQWPVLTPEGYATLLHRLGFARQSVRLQVYLHVVESSDAVVEWVKGTLLTDYEKRLGPELYARYLQQFRAEVAQRLGPARPYAYAFKRVLMWGAR